MCFESAPDYSGAAAIQAQAAQRAADTQMQMFHEAAGMTQPWRQAGTAGVKQISGLLGLPGYTPVDPTQTLQATPGYQWGLGQGVQALDRSAASRGMALSGPQRNAVQAFGQNYALQNAWQPYMSALQNLSGQGLSGAGMTGNWAMQTGQIVGQDYMAAAQAQANAMIQQQLAQQQQSSGLFGGLGSLIGLGLGAFGGMPGLGAGLGGALGGMFGGGGGGSYIPSSSGMVNSWGGGGGGLGGFLAEGGPALADKPYVVGEKGPELFVPKQSGYVVPNYALASRSRSGMFDPKVFQRWPQVESYGGGYAA